MIIKQQCINHSFDIHSFTNSELSRPHVPELARDLIKQLLRTDPAERLGLDAVLKHPFVEKFFCEGGVGREAGPKGEAAAEGKKVLGSDLVVLGTDQVIVYIVT